MVYTISDNRKDREYNKFLGVQTGSLASVAVSVVGGSIYIGSVSAEVDSVYIQSGDNINITSGSVYITNSSDVGGYAGSETYVKAGSIQVDGGSVYVTNFSAGTGYAGSDVWQGTDPWLVEGSVAISSPISVTTGSEQWIQNVVEVSGEIFTGGDLTGSVVISSAPVLGVSGDKLDNLVGSFYSTGRDWSLGSTTDSIVSMTKGAANPFQNHAVSHAAGSTVVWAASAGSQLVITDVLCSTQSGTGEQTVGLESAGTVSMITYLASNGGFVSNLQTPIRTIVGGSLLMTTQTVGSTAITVGGYLE